MALIKCPECGKEVSDEAECCIHCGKPLNKSKPINKLPKEDVVIACRREVSVFAPIFWLVVVILFVTSGIIFGPSKDYPVLFALNIILNVLLTPLCIPCIIRIVKRTRSNAKDKPVIIYRSSTDCFEINHLNKEPILIKRSSVVKVYGDIVSEIWFKDQNGKVRKIKAAYCDDSCLINQAIKNLIALK